MMGASIGQVATRKMDAGRIGAIRAESPVKRLVIGAWNYQLLLHRASKGWGGDVSPEKIAELRVKHLEMIQALVTRMASYGASFKNYCITVVTAVIGLGFTLHRPSFAALALLPLIGFAIADAQYLRVERQFRELFDAIRREEWSTMPSFEINLKNASAASYWRAATSWSILGFYGPLAVGTLLLVLLARLTHVE